MQTFLQALTDALQHEYGEDLSALTLVFPTRRAGLFFRQELAARAKKPFWSPRILTIRDFVAELSPYTVPDQVSLQFSLYKIYTQYFQGESFDRFYPWGELMLQDFSDIDHYMADASKVFSVINDLREIEQEFQLPEEELEKLKSFWMSYFSKDPSKLKTEFINTWKHLGNIYSSFKNSMLADGHAYEGLLYRELAQQIQSGNLSADKFHNKLVFAGFYALTKAEEIIIEYFFRELKAKVFRDADTYYADQDYQEAGTFFRKGFLSDAAIPWKQSYFGKEDKEITITGIPLLVGQAKYAGELIQNMLKDPDFTAEKTALVLPDENLLFPVLYSLPPELSDINVTMGYPLRITPLYHLFESLMNLRKNHRKESDGGSSFYYRDVLNVLNHPYIRIVAPPEIKKWMTKYNSSRPVRLTLDDLNKEKHILFRTIFIRLSGRQDLFEWLRSILKLILSAMKEDDFKFHRIESEFVVQFYTHLSRLEDALIKQDIEVEAETSWFLFREIIQSVKIPFTGEPLKGLQVMGFLETRVLDFDRVIVLSVNEDVLPASGNKPSFIPFNIRKAFGLPTFEDQHAVSAYHFYRLLQRAGKVHLLYNTESKAIAGGDKSRFLLQIENELAVQYPDKIKLNQNVVGTSFTEESPGPIIVAKSGKLLDDLDKYFGAKGEDGEDKYSASFSASALNTYISCTFKFYLRYMAGLKEEDETQEYMEAAGFGSILHETMQLLYQDQAELSPAVLKEIKLKVDNVLDEVVKETLQAGKYLEGKNLLLRNVLKELILKILRIDADDGPVQLLSVEKKVYHNLLLDAKKKIQLFGIVDRIDQRGELIRILDYKTGKVIKRKLNSISDLFSNPDLKEQFQAMLYAYMLRKDFPGKNLISGLVTLRDMADGIYYLNNEQAFSAQDFGEFESGLKKLLTDLFDPSIPFVQTEDEKRCVYCPYKGICNRE